MVVFVVVTVCGAIAAVVEDELEMEGVLTVVRIGDAATKFCLCA